MKLRPSQRQVYDIIVRDRCLRTYVLDGMYEGSKSKSFVVGFFFVECGLHQSIFEDVTSTKEPGKSRQSEWDLRLRIGPDDYGSLCSSIIRG